MQDLETNDKLIESTESKLLIKAEFEVINSSADQRQLYNMAASKEKLRV